MRRLRPAERLPRVLPLQPSTATGTRLQRMRLGQGGGLLALWEPVMATTLHLLTQRDQPYGSVRKCCEMCGAMLVTRSDAYWRSNTYTDNPADWQRWPAGTANVPDELVPCTVQARHEPTNVI